VFKANKHVIRITCHNYSIVLAIILHCYRHYTVLASHRYCLVPAKSSTFLSWLDQPESAWGLPQCPKQHRPPSLAVAPQLGCNDSRWDVARNKRHTCDEVTHLWQGRWEVIDTPVTRWHTCDEAGRFQLDTLSEPVVVVLRDPLPLPLAAAADDDAMTVVAVGDDVSVMPSLGLVVAMSQYLLLMMGTWVWSKTNSTVRPDTDQHTNTVDQLMFQPFDAHYCHILVQL